MPPPKASGSIGWNIWLIGLVLLGTIIYAFFKCKSDQSNNAAGTMIAALIALFFVSPTDVIHGVVVVIGALVVLFFGIRSIRTAETREAALKESDEQHAAERREDSEQIARLQSDISGLNADMRTALETLRNLVAAMIPPISGSAHGVQAPQTVTAEGAVEFVLWPARLTLREQVIDLIRNCRRAAEALRITPDDQYMNVLAIIAEPWVGPSIAIRQGLRRALGYPAAEPLNHLPPGTTPEEFDTIAEVHERLLKSIPTDAPAVPLTDSE